MKTALIVVLALALAAAAFFTRPNDASFKAFITQELRQRDKDKGLLGKIINDFSIAGRIEDVHVQGQSTVDKRNEGGAGCVYRRVFALVQADVFQRCEVEVVSIPGKFTPGHALRDK